MAAQRAKANKLLVECSAGKASKGAKLRLERLLRGEMPRPERDKLWPNGEQTPKPKKIILMLRNFRHRAIVVLRGAHFAMEVAQNWFQGKPKSGPRGLQMALGIEVPARWS